MYIRKFILSLIFLIALIVPGYSAEVQELGTDYIISVQLEISNDISALRKSIKEELAEIKLDKTSVENRINELAKLSETVSDDMAVWGYTPEQRELHERILSELNISWASYASLIQTIEERANKKISADITNVTDLAVQNSPDINMSDELRKEITRTSRGLDIQVFYLQSKISKLRLDLAEAVRLKQELKEAQEGGTGLELPRTHLLQLENVRLNIALSQMQVRGLKKTFDQNVNEIKRLRRRLVNISGNLVFTQKILDSNLEKIQNRINELTNEMKEARKALDSANLALTRAKITLGKSDIYPLSSASSNYLARSARVTYWEYMISVIEEEISLNREAQDIWKNRFKLFNDRVPGEEIWKIRDESEKKINDLQRQLESVRSLESRILKQISETQTQANSEGLNDVTRQNMLKALDNQQKIISDIMNRYESFIPDLVFLNQRLNSEANNNLSALRLAEKVTDFSKETVMAFLNTKLWDGEGYSVTVSKLIIAVLVFLSSFFLSSWGSNLLKRRIIRRAKSSITAANAIQRIVFYILWIAFVLIALNIVDIPLTAFAFMGGAMAVGIGFGMQNIFNNLISGFIVIFSRPFKVNDIIEVAGTSGKVEDIGSRSTTIKTWDGFDVVLPNRYFLENSVTNWTGSDMKKREILKVGVGYNSDTREVENLLMEIVKGHSKVLKDPAPFVIFKNFGDYALEYEIYYWIDLKTSSGMKVSSDMRHHIKAVFERENIEIPYPQRVMHVTRLENKIKNVELEKNSDETNDNENKQ